MLQALCESWAFCRIPGKEAYFILTLAYLTSGFYGMPTLLLGKVLPNIERIKSPCIYRIWGGHNASLVYVKKGLVAYKNFSFSQKCLLGEWAWQLWFSFLTFSLPCLYWQLQEQSLKYSDNVSTGPFICFLSFLKITTRVISWSILRGKNVTGRGQLLKILW